MKALFVTLACLLCLASVAQSQTVVNPRSYEFVPSADHDAVIDGQAVVVRYEMRYLQIGGVAVGVVDLGKPSPVDGKITGVLNVSMVPTSPSARYVAYVAAIGPTGEGISAASNPFAQVGPPANPGPPTVKR
jgi:hypothetical protein